MNKDQKLVSRFLKMGYFIGCDTAVPLKLHVKLGPGFGQPNAKIGQKIVNSIQTVISITGQF